MDTRRLIDGIVQQTTVLIAQLSTAAGVRAPLAHVADQVFYELSREIEAQGVGRKVVADMFGLALRSYQKKVQRLSESVSVRDRTLWEAIYEYLRESGTTPRKTVMQRFARDPQPDVAAVLKDLVSSGLIYSTGRGDNALFGVTSDADRSAFEHSDRAESAVHLVWLTVYRAQRLTTAELRERTGLDEEQARLAVNALLADGRVTVQAQGDDDVLGAARLMIPVGAEQGWEAAVFDHYLAVCGAIARKIRGGKHRSQSDDVVGGATLRFEVYPGHPHEKSVYGLLERVRGDVNTLWQDVSNYNASNPAEQDRTRVCFYFGQSVEDDEQEAAEEAVP